MSHKETDTRLVNLLREIGDLCEHASLTGAFAGGAEQAAGRYNAILRILEEDDSVPPGLFTRLNDNAPFGQVGVEARMLASFLEGEKKRASACGEGFDTSVLVRLAPFVRGEDLGDLVREQVRQGSTISAKVLTSLAPFLDSGSLGDLIKSHLRESKQKVKEEAKQAKESARVSPREIIPAGDVPRMTLEDLAREIKRPDLTKEERQELAIKIAEIAHEQAANSL